VLTTSDYVQIIVAVIYAVALYYTVITFKRSKELDQIRVTETIFNDLRQLDRELSTLQSDSHDDQGRKELYSRILNTVDWLSFLINTKVITDRRMIAYMKPTLIQYYEDTFIQNMLADERYSNSYHQFKKLYQRMKLD
jgi:short-subunit dehydrogenase involved in D-alanine esterification of teichoic acids